MAPHLFDSVLSCLIIYEQVQFGVLRKRYLLTAVGTWLQLTVHLLFIYAVLSIGHMKLLIQVIIHQVSQFQAYLTYILGQESFFYLRKYHKVATDYFYKIKRLMQVSSLYRADCQAQDVLRKSKQTLYMVMWFLFFVVYLVGKYLPKSTLS